MPVSQIISLLYSFSQAGNKGSDELWRNFGIYFNSLDYSDLSSSELTKVILSFGLINRGSNAFWSSLEKALQKNIQKFESSTEIILCLKGFCQSKAGSSIAWGIFKEKIESTLSSLDFIHVAEVITQVYVSGRRHSLEIFELLIKRFGELYPTLNVNEKVYMYNLLKSIDYLPKEILNIFMDVNDIDDYEEGSESQEEIYNERIRKNSQYIYDKFLS